MAEAFRSIVSTSSVSPLSARLSTRRTFNERRMSYLRHMAIKMPGMTMSPRPRRLNLGGSYVQSVGNRSLMGASMLLATVSITSVPKTKNMS